MNDTYNIERNPAGARHSFHQEIVGAHSAASGALRDAVAHAVRAGELLAQAKAALPHGSFGAFCAALPFGATTARGYMRLAALDPVNRQRVADMPLRAALLELAEPRAAPTCTPSSILIPLGSCGLVGWQSTEGTTRCLEVHPALWPDGETVGLHYALADITLAGDMTCDASRRPMVTTVEALAAAFHAPLEHMHVFEGQPALWAPEMPS